MNERRGSLPRRVRRIGLLVAGLMALTSLVGHAALAAPPTNGPPGNNGTVKVHEGPGEPSSEVRNEPHVCTFHLHFFFADPEQAGTWEIQKWSPGAKGQVVLSGTYDTAGDGEDRDPDAGVYDLPDGHYKLFWDGDLDTGKHDKMKVFWVECETQGGVSNSAPPSSGTQPAESHSTPKAGGSESAPAQGDTSGAGPSGQELAAGGGPATLPPTDTARADALGQDVNWPIALMIIATIIAIASLLTPAKRPDRRSH